MAFYTGKQMKKLIIENTYRSLLIYMLTDPFWQTRDYILIKGRMSDDFISRFRAKVNSVLIMDDFPTLSLKSPLKSILTRVKFLNKIKEYDEIYGNVYELKLRKVRIKLIQLDDGLMTKKILSGEFRQEIPYLALRNNILFRTCLNIDYNVDVKCFEYLVPELYKSDSCLFDCTFININKMLNSLNQNNYQEICEVFGFLPSKLQGKSILMLQPFFEDKLVSSVEYEIDMYKYILEVENLKEADIYIKPHPRSSLGYTEFFKNSEFIPKDFPYELLVRESKDHRFKKVISIHSSGLEEFLPIAEEVVSFGTMHFNQLPLYPAQRLFRN